MTWRGTIIWVGFEQTPVGQNAATIEIISWTIIKVKPYGSWPDISEVTKSSPKGDDDKNFSLDWFHKWIEAIKMKLPNSMPSQANVRIVKIE